MIGVTADYNIQEDNPDRLTCLTDDGRLIEAREDGVLDVLDAPDLKAKTRTKVRLRQAPSQTALVSATLPKGTKVSVLLCGEGWTMVKYKEETGYVMSRYLSFP